MARHRYGPEPDQRGSLRLPPGRAAARLPVAVLLHGGSWSARYGAIVVAPLAGDLVRRGWATWNLEYRRVGGSSGGGWPQTGADVLAGIDHLAALDAPLDLERVVVIGHSAGGQLALYAGAERAAAGAVRVQAVVAQAAPSDLERSARNGAPTIVRFLGGLPDDVPERYREASPIARAPLGIPQLLMHGEDDRVVGIGTSARYAERARAAGDAVTFVAIPGAGHLAHLNPWGDAWEPVPRWLEPWGPGAGSTPLGIGSS